VQGWVARLPGRPRRAMKIAAEVCVFTNDQLTVETIEG
jgi:ATP-dependent protease HslVU (ClpYQ) peptidase subunit